ncbi:hypothetical protein [Methylobacterium frigidaeris]|uniref:Uncharacterized protein n=1 Tax=Methylobacterium frigidaeris TaxID=2038277 RepID=A0AA37HJC2_9HYPH|nr:hypothetical protein [Methylobacterium frigidaeris]PIK71365.1 hypothetical protein CS379_19740 [Methylobacterium frigidaeris]GJD66210.1 hypothetical protein MPEAHAMD_6407 [Methylobacterium frigidaeris]
MTRIRLTHSAKQSRPAMAFATLALTLASATIGSADGGQPSEGQVPMHGVTRYDRLAEVAFEDGAKRMHAVTR